MKNLNATDSLITVSEEKMERLNFDGIKPNS